MRVCDLRTTHLPTLGRVSGSWILLVLLSMLIKKYDLRELSPDALSRLLKRSEQDIEEASEIARRLIEEVVAEGDHALVRHLAQIDRVQVDPARLRVSPEEFAQASATLSEEVKQAVRVAVDNIRSFHTRQLPPRLTLEMLSPGVFAGEQTTAIDRVGLYVPKGKGSFPSVMAMLAVPAQIAGCSQIVVCTPPSADGTVDAASLYAAELAGVKNIIRIGGASAIAAFAYGTQSVPKVDKILGPCNRYGSAAKRLLKGVIDTGLPAGPSEAIIFADEFAEPRMVAIDLLNEAEHGPDSAALLVTHSVALSDAVTKLLPDLVTALPEPRRAFCTEVLHRFGGIVLTRDLSESLAFINDYAPEHLQVLIRDPFSVLGKINNAGEILLGEYTPISVANYCLGVNAILPTGGFAKTVSCTSIRSFLKGTSIAYCTREGFTSLRGPTQILAEYEGFPAHTRTARDR